VADAIQRGRTVDAAARRITLAVGKNRDAVLWAAVWAVAGVETRVVGRKYLRVAASVDAAVRLATLYAPISTTRAALNTRQKGQRAEVAGFLKFLKGGKGRGRRPKEAEEAYGRERDEGGAPPREAGGRRREDPRSRHRALRRQAQRHNQSLGRWGDVYKILFYRLKKGARYPQFYVRGVETKARAEKLIEVLTGIPRVTPMSDGGIKRLLVRCEELREAIERWSGRKALEAQKTFKQTRYESRRGCPSQVNGAGGCPPG